MYCWQVTLGTGYHATKMTIDIRKKKKKKKKELGIRYQDRFKEIKMLETKQEEISKI